MPHLPAACDRNPVFLANLLVILSAILVTGCRPADEIRNYRVLKSRSGLDALKTVSKDSLGAPAEKTKSRMVVAIAAKEKATWFLKIIGPIEDVNAIEPKWREFFAKLDFDDNGNPKWELPEGWKDIGSDNSMRYTTLQIPNGDSTLDLVVSSLSAGQDLLDNVNRWRGQIGLPAIEDAESHLQPLDSTGGRLLLFDDIGFSSGSMSTGRGAPTTSQVSGKTGLRFKTPEGWTEGPVSSFVKVRLVKEVGDQKIQISVTDLPAEANRWEPNVDRWMGELGIEVENKQAFVDQNTSEIEVGGLKANRLVLISDKETIEKATVAVMAIRDDLAWFFKLTGPRQMVADHVKDFDQFIESFEFE